jgi:hypothetical protein
MNGSYSAYYAGSFSHNFLEAANLPGGNYIYCIFDMNTGCRWMRSNSPGSYSTIYYISGSWYDGTGTSGVVMADVCGLDLDSQGNAYILENDGGGNFGVEKWIMGTTPTYQNVLFANDLSDPKDITCDSNDYLYVLDDTAAGAEIWVYDTSGNVVGKSGNIDSTDMPGDPRRLDADVFSSPDHIHVLHTGGVSRFSAF